MNINKHQLKPFSPLFLGYHGNHLNYQKMGQENLANHKTIPPERAKSG